MEKTHVIRYGGMVPSFFVSESIQTCHPSEAKLFTEIEANELANNEQKNHSCGVRPMPIIHYSK